MVLRTSKKRRVSIAITEDDSGRRIVTKFQNGAIAEQPVASTPNKRARWKFRYPTLDKSKKRGV